MPPGTLFQAESTLTYATATGDYNGDGFIDFVSHKDWNVTGNPAQP